MQPTSHKQGNSSRDCEVYDPISQSYFYLSDGQLCKRSQSDSNVQKYELPQLFENQRTTRQSLRFKKVNSSSIVFGPSGRSLACKSDKIHEVDMNITYTQGISMWNLCCSSNCLCLIVGVKNSQKKKQHCLQFTVQNTTKISFKLDISGKRLKAWLNKNLSVVEKKINLSEQINEWTPFIRVKGTGVNIFLSELVEDPENKISNYNIFGVRNTNIEPKLSLVTKQISKLPQNFTLKLIDPNTLLLHSKQQVRLIRRSRSEKEFNNTFGQFGTDGLFYIRFSQSELSILKRIGFELSEKNGSYCAKTIEDWKNWMISAFTLLDTQLNSQQISKQLCYRAYQILLSRVQTFKGYLKTSLRPSIALQSDVLSNWGANNIFISMPQASIKVPNSVRLNNQNPFKLQKELRTITWTQHFLIILFDESERVIILNREDSLFRLGEINMKKGFKKQYELNQYQKQLDQLQSNSSNEPSIYKILKNCLKYADKVKAPERQKQSKEKSNSLTKKENKSKVQKQDKKLKKTESIVPNESLVNTLVGMGFSQAQSKNALIEAKNSLEKAIQLIFSQGQKQVKSLPKKSDKWDCGLCTFINEPSVLACAMCGNAKPQITQQAQKQLEEIVEKQQQMQEDKQKQVEEEVESKNIDSELQKLFAWQLGFAYSPLILAGCFKDKLRLRLFGPNPKYYSIFYNKDQQFVDLSTLTIHNEAHKIDQRAVRYQYFLSTTSNQQKEAAYGWISIQDFDIDIKGNIDNVTFNKVSQANGKITFTIQVTGQLNEEKWVKNFTAFISIEKIYAQKKRSIEMDKSEAKVQQKQEIFQVAEDTEQIKNDSNVIPKNGYLEVSLARNNSKNQTIRQVVIEAATLDKINQVKPYLPIIASSQQGSAQISTLISSLQAGQKPLILKHLHNKSITVEYIVLQKLGKNSTHSNYKGTITFSEDPKKKPIKVINFTLQKGKKKFYIETKYFNPTYFVTLSLSNDEGNQESIVYEQLSLIGIIGDEVERSNQKNGVKTAAFNHKFEILVKDKQQKIEKGKFKVQTEIINSEYDLNSLPSLEGQTIVQELIKSQSRLDILIRISSLQGRDLNLESLELEGWSIVKMKSVWSTSQKTYILEETFKQNLEKFLQTFDYSLLDDLTSEQCKDYIKLIKDGNYNLTNFFNNHVLSKKIEKSKIRKLISFFQTVSQYFEQIKNAGNLEITQIVKSAVESEEIDVNNLQLIFEVAKSFAIQEQAIMNDLSKKLKLFSLREQGKGKKSNKQNQQSGSYGGYRDKLMPQQNTIYNRYVLKKGKLYRKYTIDMINVYRLTQFSLNFEKAQKKSSALKIVLKSLTNSGNWKIQYEKIYPQFVWEQVAVCPFSEQFEKNVKNSKSDSHFNYLTLSIPSQITSRYLQLQVCFTCHPNIGSAKDIENIPQSEIVPEIQGYYVGQNQHSLQIFKYTDPSSLAFIKNVNGINKFNVKNLSNLYYYDTDQVQSKDENKMIKSEESEESKRLYQICCIYLDELISKGSDKVSEQFINALLSVLMGLQKSPLTKKIILFLKKVARTNVQIASFIFKLKLPSEYVFNSIMKESKLTLQNISTILDNNPTHTEVQNAIYFAKQRDQKAKQLFIKILPLTLKTKNIEDTFVLHQKHGWVQGTTKLLDMAIEQDKKKLFKSIVTLSKDNKQLANYTQTLLQRQGLNEEFSFAFEELMSNGRKIKQQECKNLLISLIKHLETNIENQESYDQSETLQKFTMLIGSINKLQVSNQIIKSYVNLFSKLPYKQTMLNKFLSIKQFKQTECVSYLIGLCVNLLSSYSDNSSKNHENLNLNLYLTHEIMIYIFRNESQNSCNWIENVMENEANSLSELYSQFVIKELCFGGQSNSKIIHADQRLKLSVGFCMANLIIKLGVTKDRFNQKLNLSEKCIKSLIKWLMINENLGQIEGNKVSTSNFAKIQEANWLLITSISNKNVNVVNFFKQEFQKLQAEINKIKNKVSRKIYEKKMLQMCVKYLQRVEGQTISQKLISEMFGRFISRIINSDAHELQLLSENDNGKSSNLLERQFANSFQAEKQITNKPKDWLVYKNGAKNSVFKFDYPKGSHESFELILKLNQNEQINLSKIVIGFEQIETAQQSYCIPRQISVEGGRKLNQLKFIGKLVEIPDNHYINYSVRVFGLNCSQILANKLSSSLNKYPQIRYLKISMRYPEVGYATDALSVGDLSKSKNFGSSINFLSIQGYSQTLPPHPQIENIQSFIKKISSYTHKQSLKKLFENAGTVKLFKDSLINLSTIMKSELYSDDINKFIMRVCEVNNQIGNETIEKYLHLGNSETCSKIVSEIILSNDQSLKSRVVLLHNFITKCFNSDLQKFKLLEPFLNKFCQIVYTVEKNKNLKKQKIQLQFNTQLFCTLIKQENKSTIFAKYLCVVMKLEEPFVSAKLDHSQIYEHLNSSSLTLNREVLEALVVSEKNARKWFMQNNCLQKIVQRTITTIKSKNEDFTALRNDLQTLSSLCYNSNIKSIVNKSQYNLEIFNLMVSKQNSGILVGEKNAELRESFVNFINKSVLGSENQLRIAQLLKQSLASSQIDQNKYFVGQVFLPILNSYSKTTLCMHPYDSEQNKILIDMNIKSRTKSTKSKPEQKSSTSNKFRLPTNLITSTIKSQLFQKIKQKSAFQGGNFNLVANHGTEATGMYNSIQKSIRNTNQSLLMLFKVTSSQKSQILGIFYREDSSTRKVPLYWNEKCLMFIASDKEPTKFLDVTKQSGKKLLSFFEEASSDYDDAESYIEKIIEIHNENVPFCQICFTNLFGPSYINLDVLRGTSFGEYKLQSAEYWLFEPIVSTQISKPKQQISLTDQILNLYSISFFQSSFQSRSILRLLRSNKIYEFPTSITLRQLKIAVQIMKCKLKQDHQNSLKIRTMDLQEIANDTTIQSLVKKNDQIPIFDILCDVNSVGTYLDYNSEGKSKPTSYLPKRGIMKHFEEINGVTSMIRVIKKSIEGWKNKDRRQKWHQYVLELEKFSSFPHFFGMYLKDNETFDLLFKLLSGLPDTEQDKKWDELESKSTQKLLKIIAQILSVDKTTEFRQYAMKHQFFHTILERLKILTGQFKRQWREMEEKQTEQLSPSKTIEDDGTKQIKKKKGVGYGNDTSSTTKWMKGSTEAELMKQFEVIELILNIIENFLDLKHWNVPKKVLENIYESALLPYLQDSLRAGTLLQISKIPAKFRLVFKILKTLAKNPNLVPILMPLSKNYHPKQIQSLQSLIKSLENTSTIFLSCLSNNSKQTNTGQKLSQQLAKDIIATSKLVEQAIEDYVEAHHDEGDDNEMKNILQMPLDKKYRLLLKDLRFDYMDMKEGNNKIKHHYSSNFNANYVPNQAKMIRLAQQLADISTALPYEHTNAVFVRCDKDRADFMQALIMGSNGTPYGHGAFLFDVYFDDNYPNGPPKVNLTTTGHGKVRFNPNLYACGKVCLSLLGTWRGSACQNWDPKVSTLLQVLLSIQAIIMSQEIYFNEPGFEGEQGTPQGEKKNEAYSNIVRYCNIKFAMIDNMKNPPKGFENIIKRHFYLKQHEIMDECKKWLLYAEKRPANYIGLVNDHNNSWSTQFKKTKTQYKQMLEKAIQQLSQQFKKLPVPSIHDITSRKAQKKSKKKKQNNTDMLKKLEEQTQQQIDVGYQNKEVSAKQIDINDEKVKDRWSRYIGAMGIDAVSKQSKADILVFGLGPVALEVIKNLVLSGCRKLTIVDDKLVRYEDLSGGFFFSEAEVGKKRIQSILYKIRQLNVYVKVDTLSPKDITEEVIKGYNLIFATQMSLSEQFKLNQQCRAQGVKFTSAEFRGAYCRVFNDFGDKFEVLDKNGQQPVEVIIKSISSAPNGLVTLLDGTKHPFEDGEVIHLKNVEGMAHKQDKTKSINGTLHKVKVINSKSFEIGDTTMYEPYIRNGLAKNIKTPVILKFQSMKQVYENSKQKLPLDENLQFFDFTKMGRNKQIHFCFVALDTFVQENGKLPSPWDIKDADKFIEIFTKVFGEEVTTQIKNYVRKFSFTCSGYLPPLGAYLGGFISQQIIKAITQKFKPLDSIFYMDAEQIIPEVADTQNKQKIWSEMISKKDHRDKGFEIVVGHQLLQLIKNSTSFMIGSGAIGCELLKNFAMVGLGTGEKGKITLTDPDHIENSNLNRQFLFREKHISKPKSRTAAASILLMNPLLKGHISALLERVSESTKNIFSNKFFQSLTFVANALDNVAARRYVDQRCVENKIALFESGTLGPKGHIQVILPYKTESYGSQNDPVEDGQIPHCTLKMFPEQTLHCVQWARDIFGKKFSLQPKAFVKIKDAKFKPEKDDIKSINECIVMATKGPKTFQDCISYAVSKFYKYFRDDIMQLMYTYPIDAKTKDGEPFWKLPKRPPTPILKIDPENILHCTFIASMAVLVAKIYKITYPKSFRQQKQRFIIGKEANKIKVPDFVPSDQKAKSILKEIADEKKQNKVQQEQEKEKELDQSDKNQVQLFEEFLKESKQMQVQAEQFEKDNDQNGHIDFIYSMANLRASNYKLDDMDWITTKLKAGRIVPALATTTTCVAGLQTLQICKYIKSLKLQSMRNSFLNLAVPSLQMSQPGEVKKTKINDKVEVNLWDRWQVKCNQNTTFRQVFEELSKKYQLNPIGVLQGMSRIDTSKTEQGKKQFLNSKLLDKLDKEDDCIDIIVLFTKSQDQQKLLQNLPPVRLRFEMKKIQ